jgi:hypothetical protein
VSGLINPLSPHIGVPPPYLLTIPRPRRVCFLRSILIDVADMDKDGKIGMDDFRLLSDSARLQKEERERQAALAARQAEALANQRRISAIPTDLMPDTG